MPIDQITVPNDEFRDQAVPGIPADGEPRTDYSADGTDTVEEQPDGSAVVTESEEDQNALLADHYANLAETLDPQRLSDLANEYLELIELDFQSREKRDEQYEEGIRRTGLGNDAPGGAQFSGASKVVHPSMAEACVDFEAAAIKELFPPIGPVKTQIIGESSRQDVDRAERKRQFMNWQLTVQMPEYRPELERLLTQLPLGGSQYQKFRWNTALKRPESEFVAIDNLIVPFSATSFYGSPRITHRMFLTADEVESRVDEGLYLDPDLAPSGHTPDVSKAEEATQKIEGKTDTGFNEDGVRVFYEVQTSLKDIDDGSPRPYVMTIDEFSRKVVGLYRNWAEEDDRYEKLDWFVDWTFIPWRGATGVGLPHLIGGLSAASTGTLRALLDAAHIANAATVVKLKGGRITGQTTEVAVTEIKELDSPPGVDDIRKLMMPIPFPGPNGTLFQLLGWLTDATKGLISTAEEKLANVGNQTPVGTTMALIESGAKVYSAIHARLHASHARALQIIHRLNGQYLDEHQEIKELSGLSIKRTDFTGSLDIVPVSDPSIFSEAQRFAQIQALLQMAAADAQDGSVPWNKIELRHRMMRLMHVEDPDKLLPQPKDPITSDPVTENMTIAEGGQVKADQSQDHAAHLVAHLNFIISPIHLLDDAPDPTLGDVLGHCREHLLMLYKETIARSTADVIGSHLNQMSLPGRGTIQ